MITPSGLSRRAMLVTGAALLSARHAFAADEGPVGTYPAGTSGSSVFVGIGVPLTGTYAEQGVDLQKGVELAIAHLNTGHELIRKISTLTTKGVLGKQVEYGVADTEAKPNTAVQAQSHFIADKKAIVMIGSVSSAVAVALNKLADREKGHLPAGDFRLQRHHRQGLLTLQLPGLRLCPHRGWGDQPGAWEGAWPWQEGCLPDPRLHLRPHRAAVDGGVHQEIRLDHGHRPGLPARRQRLQLLSAQHRQLGRRRAGQHQFRQRRGQLDQAGRPVRHHGKDDPGDAVQHAIHQQERRARDDAGCLCDHRVLVDAGQPERDGEDVRRHVQGQVWLQPGMGRAYRLHADRAVGGRRGSTPRRSIRRR